MNLASLYGRNAGGLPVIPFVFVLSMSKIVAVTSTLLTVVGILHASYSSSTTLAGKYSFNIIVFDLSACLVLLGSMNMSCLPGVLFFLVSLCSCFYDPFFMVTTKFAAISLFNTTLSFYLSYCDGIEKNLLESANADETKEYTEKKSMCLKILSGICSSGLGRTVLFMFGGGLSSTFDIRATGLTVAAMLASFNEYKLGDIRVSSTDTNISTGKAAMI